MKNIIFILTFFFACTTTLIAESPFGRMPTVNSRESEAIASASSKADKQQALQILKEASENKWAGGAIFFNLGNVQMSLGDCEEAISSYKRALELTPSFFLAQKNLSFALESSGKSEEAFDEMKKALALSGGSDVDILMRMVSRYSQLRDFSSALTLCNQALVYDSQNPKLCFAKAVFLFELENFSECEKMCIQLISKNNSDILALRLLGKSRAKRGDIRSAISAFEILKKSGKAEKSDLAFLGDLFFREKLYNFAIENYLLANKNISAENAALALLYSGEPNKTLKVAEMLKSPFKEKLLGSANFELGNFRLALSLLKKYLKLVPDDNHSALVVGESALELGNLAEADEYFARSSIDEKYKTQSLYGKMKVALARNDFRSALKIAKEIEKRNASSEFSDYVKQLEKYIAQMD